MILLASNFPFRQMIGIEYARELATVAGFVTSEVLSLNLYMQRKRVVLD